MENSWLTPNLIQKVKSVFEPRYKRALSDKEVVVIAENLMSVAEIYSKFIWRTENANTIYSRKS